jgi:hypothetical protein
LEKRKQITMRTEEIKMNELRYWIVDRVPEFEDAIERFRRRHEGASEVVEALGRVQRGGHADKETLTSIALVLWIVDRDECIRRFGDNSFTRYFLEAPLSFNEKSLCGQLEDLHLAINSEELARAELAEKTMHTRSQTLYRCRRQHHRELQQQSRPSE